jgi:anti-anti-sigma factor
MFHLQTLIESNTRSLVLRPTERKLGSLDDGALIDLERAVDSVLKDIGCDNVVLDLSLVGYYGSGLVAQIVKLYQRLAQERVKFAVCGDQHGVLSVAGLDRLFRIVPDLRTTLAILRDDNRVDAHDAASPQERHRRVADLAAAKAIA